MNLGSFGKIYIFATFHPGAQTHSAAKPYGSMTNPNQGVHRPYIWKAKTVLPRPDCRLIGSAALCPLTRAAADMAST